MISIDLDEKQWLMLLDFAWRGVTAREAEYGALDKANPQREPLLSWCASAVNAIGSVYEQSDELLDAAEADA